ncbi:hypothetical protein HanPSC8_Chr13g0562501 [Helianthus annuus]|nr:hypothetical protein HanPSC8_Chr13g0562501 [Helianthus annuus]
MSVWLCSSLLKIGYALNNLRAFTFYPSKYVRECFYILKGIKSGCEWRREKMLLFICIFEGTLFTHYNFFNIY